MGENQTEFSWLEQSSVQNLYFSVWLRSANHMKFTEEYTMCTEKHVFDKQNVYK